MNSKQRENKSNKRSKSLASELIVSYDVQYEKLGWKLERVASTHKKISWEPSGESPLLSKASQFIMSLSHFVYGQGCHPLERHYLSTIWSLYSNKKICLSSVGELLRWKENWSLAAVFNEAGELFGRSQTTLIPHYISDNTLSQVSSLPSGTTLLLSPYKT